MEQGRRIHKVVAAALRAEDGTVTSLPPPARHNDVIRQRVEDGAETPVTDEQGFLLDDGRFVNRHQAWAVAMRAGQVKEEDLTVQGTIFSEDLW